VVLEEIGMNANFRINDIGPVEAVAALRAARLGEAAQVVLAERAEDIVGNGFPEGAGGDWWSVGHGARL
jgi:hypothetical protein